MTAIPLTVSTPYADSDRGDAQAWLARTLDGRWRLTVALCPHDETKEETSASAVVTLDELRRALDAAAKEE